MSLSRNRIGRRPNRRARIADIGRSHRQTSCRTASPLATKTLLPDFTNLGADVVVGSLPSAVPVSPSGSVDVPGVADVVGAPVAVADQVQAVAAGAGSRGTRVQDEGRRGPPA